MPSLKIITLVLLIISSASTIFGVLFKIMHWPGADLLIKLGPFGLLGAGILFVVFLISRSRKKRP